MPQDKLIELEQLSDEEYCYALKLFWECPGNWTVAHFRAVLRTRAAARSQSTPDILRSDD